MKKVSENINEVYSQLGKDNSFAKIAHRAAQVRAMWAACVDEYILEHTNAVYIVKNTEEIKLSKEQLPGNQNENTPPKTKEEEAGKTKTLIAYVDDSITATELNARRELIKLKLLQEHNEKIDELKIFISRGDYRKNYPFRKKEEGENGETPIPLTKKEKKEAENIASVIEDDKLREIALKAIIADKEWKKSTTPQNPL